MEGYRDETYGERIADVYDDWFRGVRDVDGTVRFLDELAGRRPARILELAVGTGRLAIPLATRGHDVTGVDVSAAMLDRLRAADTEGRVTVVEGDMVDDLPSGPFDLVFVAFNSLFMVTDAERQAACFKAVAGAIAPEGCFVVEAFVPYDPPRQGTHVEVRSMTADQLALHVSVTDPDSQTVNAQFVELADGQPVRLRPFRLRWSRPAELDAWAEAAGLQLAERFAGVDRTPFTDDSPFHVTIYRRGTLDR
ncbi:MAG: class I SAM-dependent DNA methyltransferase [Acidimicrobiales bacterium]